MTRVQGKQRQRHGPECSTELLVVHGGLVLALAPLLGHQFRLVQLEFALFAHPGDAIPGVLIRQQLQQELPELDLTVVT